MAKTSVAIAAMIPFLSQAQQFEDIHKQLDIMSDIVKTSVAKKVTPHGPWLSNVEHTYLAGQGAVFTMTSRGSMRSISPNMPVMPRTPVVPVAPKGMEGLFDEEFQAELEAAMAEAEVAMELAYEEADMQRELREQERELAYKQRDLARAERDLSYEKRHAEKEELAEYDKKIEKLKLKQKEVKKESEKLRAKNAQVAKKMQQTKAELEAKQKQYFADMETDTTKVLCDYGVSLKAIPDDEYVTFIFVGGGEKVNNRATDKVLVFHKADVKSCALEKIDSAQLLTKANGYYF